MRGIFGTICFALLALSVSAIADSEADKLARKKLSDKLMFIGKDLNDFKTQDMPETITGRAQEVNRNAPGTSYIANTTNHYTTTEVRIKPNVNEFLPSYGTPHSDSDSAPGEQVITAAIAKYGTIKPGQDEKSYSFMDVVARGNGPVRKSDGRLNMKNIADLRLKDDVRRDLEMVGTKSAEKDLNTKFEGNELRDPVSLRVMAGNLSRQFEANLEKNIREGRLNQKGIEVMNNERLYNSAEYVKTVQEARRLGTFDERSDEQGALDPETRRLRMNRRLALAEQMRSIAPLTVNPEVVGGRIVSGDPKNEAVDAGKNRINLAMVRDLGGDVAKYGLPNGVIIKQEDYKQQMTVYDDNGNAVGVTRVSNNEQIENYNRALREAAAGMKAVLKKDPNLRDDTKRILDHQRGTGGTLAGWNDPTAEQFKTQLAGTEYESARLNGATASAPPQNSGNLTITPQ